MSVCLKCHRPLRLPSVDGYGPVCRRTVKPIPEVGRDLFGFDIAAAVAAASERLRAHIERLASDARFALYHDFAEARMRLGL